MQTDEPNKPAEAQSFLTDELADTRRLDWLICHADARMDSSSDGTHVVFWDSRINPPCRVIARGGMDMRSAIDNAMRGAVAVVS